MLAILYGESEIGKNKIDGFRYILSIYSIFLRASKIPIIQKSEYFIKDGLQISVQIFSYRLS